MQAFKFLVSLRCLLLLQLLLRFACSPHANKLQGGFLTKVLSKPHRSSLKWYAFTSWEHYLWHLIGDSVPDDASLHASTCLICCSATISHLCMPIPSYNPPSCTNPVLFVVGELFTNFSFLWFVCKFYGLFRIMNSPFYLVYLYRFEYESTFIFLYNFPWVAFDSIVSQV